jgi:hypothetical protein
VVSHPPPPYTVVASATSFVLVSIAYGRLRRTRADDIYCSTWSGVIEDDMFILEDIWKNAIQKGSVTFLGFIRRCHWLLSYEWLEMKSFMWEDIRRQTAETFIDSASMKRIFAVWVGPTWREKDPTLLLSRKREGSKENEEWRKEEKRDEIKRNSLSLKQQNKALHLRMMWIKKLITHVHKPPLFSFTAQTVEQLTYHDSWDKVLTQQRNNISS